MAYVTLEEAKKHLNIDADFTDDDDYVTSLISAAEKVVALDICVPLEELEEEPGEKFPLPSARPYCSWSETTTSAAKASYSGRWSTRPPRTSI